MTGLVSEHAGGAHGPVAVGGDPVPAALGDGLEVRAGAERAVGAGQDRDGDVVVGVEGPEGVGERVGGRAVDGVASLGPVDRDRQDGPVPVGVHGHWGTSSLGTRRAVRCAVSFRVAMLRCPVRAATTRLIDVYSGWNHSSRSVPTTWAR